MLREDASPTPIVLQTGTAYSLAMSPALKPQGLAFALHREILRFLRSVSLNLTLRLSGEAYRRIALLRRFFLTRLALGCFIYGHQLLRHSPQGLQAVCGVWVRAEPVWGAATTHFKHFLPQGDRSPWVEAGAFAAIWIPNLSASLSFSRELGNCNPTVATVSAMPAMPRRSYPAMAPAITPSPIPSAGPWRARSSLPGATARHEKSHAPSLGQFRHQ